MATPARPCPKEALCYPCALRMSILFRVVPPPSLKQLGPPAVAVVVAEGTATHTSSSSSSGCDDPVKDDAHHARFTIVHETPASAVRYLASERAPTPAAAAAPAPSDQRSSIVSAVVDTAAVVPMAVNVTSGPSKLGGTNAEGKGSSCSAGMFGGQNAVRHDVTWLCVACLGLYQFMDLVHAPAVAANVRCSPFADATAISVNVNVNRCFTFTWLAAATRYYDRQGTMTERPAPEAVVPEELCNFKDFYMSDLRARVLQYLFKPHSELTAAAAASPTVTGSHGSKAAAVVVPAGMDAYLGMIREKMAADEETKARRRQQQQQQKASEVESVASVEPPRKQARGETAGEDAEVREDPEDGITTNSSSSSPAAGSSTVYPPTAQAFAYNADSTGLVCEAYCRHHPTEQLLVRQLLPPQYASNKGCVINYSVVYNYAVPFLESIAWAPAVADADGGVTGYADMRAEPREAATLSTGITHGNTYLIGSYRKMMRNLSQSPWFVNGARIGSYSLQEVVANPVLPFFFPNGVTVPEWHRATASAETVVDSNLLTAELVYGHGCYKFHSAGREDVDVRMLGTGRPFVLEMINPTRERVSATDDLPALQAAMNASHSGSVEVSDLRLTDASVILRLARHSESKVKRYRCVVWSSRAVPDPATDARVLAVNAMKDLEIAQNTPLRVMHRRSLLVRPRTIHSMRLTPLGPHWFVLEVETQAGTYVKEFVHGDMGRTRPSLASLLDARADIVQLDVVGMAMQGLEGAAAGKKE